MTTSRCVLRLGETVVVVVVVVVDRSKKTNKKSSVAKAGEGCSLHSRRTEDWEDEAARVQERLGVDHSIHLHLGERVYDWLND